MITLLCKHTHKQIKHPPILLPIITWAYMCKENMYVYLKIARVLMNKKKTAQRYTPGCQHFEWQRRTGRGTWERRDQIWLCTCFCCILHSLPKKRYLLLKMKKKNNKEFWISSPSRNTFPKLNFRSRKSSWKSGMGNQPQSTCDICSPSLGAQGGVWGIKVLTKEIT